MKRLFSSCFAGRHVVFFALEKTEANVYRLDVSTSTFTKLVSEGTRRSARQLHAMAWARADSVGARSLRIAADGKTSEKGLFVLSLEPGREAWTRLDLPDAPPPRSSGSASRRPRGTSRAASATTATRTPT